MDFIDYERIEFRSPKNTREAQTLIQCERARNVLQDQIAHLVATGDNYVEAPLSVKKPNSACFQNVMADLRKRGWEVHQQKSSVSEVTVNLFTDTVSFE